MKIIKKLTFLLGVAVLANALFFACEEAVDGKDGADGTNGVDGTDGADGANGTNGVDGINGIDLTQPMTPLTSKTPSSLLKLEAEFSSVSIEPLISSIDKLTATPNFIYGSMADGNGLMKASDSTYYLINNIEADYSIARILLNDELKPLAGEYILNASATAYTAQCSGSLITDQEHGFGPLYLSGGEWGGASKGVFATDPTKSILEAGSATLLTALGQWSTENAVPIGKDAYSDKTVVFIGDDHSDNTVPQGQLGMYVGARGDLETGKLYVLRVSAAQGVTYEMDMAEDTEYNAEWVEMTEKDIDALNQEALDSGAIGFSRLEDIDWRRGSAANQKEIYFCVTGRIKPDLVGKGTKFGRVYKVVLNDSDPKGACKITCVLDGDNLTGDAKAFHSPDNIVVTENYAYIQEDPNGYNSEDPLKDHFAQLYQYNLATGELKTVLSCDQTTAEALGYGTSSNAWELTGMVDVTDVIGSTESTFLLITQNHGWINADFTDANANSNPESNEGSVLFKVTGLAR